LYGRKTFTGSALACSSENLDSVGVVALPQSNVEANSRSSDLTTLCSVSKSLIEQVDNRL